MHKTFKKVFASVFYVLRLCPGHAAVSPQWAGMTALSKQSHVGKFDAAVDQVSWNFSSTLPLPSMQFILNVLIFIYCLNICF